LPLGADKGIAKATILRLTSGDISRGGSDVDKVEVERPNQETEKEANREKISTWAARALPVIAVTISMGVWIFSSFLNHEVHDITTKETSLTNLVIERTLSIHQEEIKKINETLKDLESIKSSISDIPKESSVYIEIKRLDSSVNDINTRSAKLESVILENPAKALETLLLRRDLDKVKEAQQAALVNLKDSIDRVYDLNKWLLGAMAVSIVTLAAGSFLKQKETIP
jgi:hypothetical protein